MAKTMIQLLRSMLRGNLDHKEKQRENYEVF